MVPGTDDWLNPPRPSPSTSSPEVSPNTSDFRFTYLGPAGTYTPLHRDVYSSYSWSANVVGRKLWWLFPPRPQILSQILVNDEPVFDVRELEDEGGGIKVVQQVRPASLAHWSSADGTRVLTSINRCSLDKSSGCPVDGTTKSSTSTLYVDLHLCCSRWLLFLPLGGSNCG